ncbi:MAG: hypothetical protein NWQ41_13920 [Saprospiraceae bacterium]|jgi:SAM-dependent methyltransferase|nr:hypothetical protein [Saprospiraceae bacterium]
MQISWWQRWWSRIADVPVVRASSPFNEELTVVIRNGRFQLCTANAIYSYGDLYDNFSQTFAQLDWELLEGTEVLLLGLGLGSIPYMLERKFDKRFHYTAVEIDPVIVQLAETYVLPDLESKVLVYQADAEIYAATCMETFDLICMDVFQDDQVPERFESAAFLLQLKKCLSASGVLLFNRLATTLADRSRSLEYFEKVFLEVFPKGIRLDTGGNYVLISDGSALKKKSV